MEKRAPCNRPHSTQQGSNRTCLIPQKNAPVQEIFRFFLHGGSFFRKIPFFRLYYLTETSEFIKKVIKEKANENVKVLEFDNAG